MFTAVLALVFSTAAPAKALNGAQIKKLQEIRGILGQSRARAWEVQEKALRKAEREVFDTARLVQITEELFDLTQTYLDSLIWIETVVPAWFTLSEATRLKLQTQAVRDGAVLLRKIATQAPERRASNYLQLRMLADKITILSMTQPEPFFFPRSKKRRQERAEMETLASQGVNTSPRAGTLTFRLFAQRLNELSADIVPEACLSALRSVDDADLHEQLFSEPVLDLQDLGPPDWSELDIPIPFAQR